MAKKLTDNQQKFLEVLFDEAAGDVLMAKRMSGYSDGTPTRSITEAGQVLDRSGLVKTEKVAVESSGGLFILPPKDAN
jgi:hypothetical protein